METIINTLIDRFASGGLREEAFFSVVLIILVIALNKYVLTPIKKNLEVLPTKAENSELFNSQKSTQESTHVRLIEMEKRLNNLNILLNSISNTADTSTREMATIRREISEVRMLIQQFQHQLLITNNANEFGNKGIR